MKSFKIGLKRHSCGINIEEYLIACGFVGGGGVSRGRVGLVVVSLGVTIVGDISDVTRVAVDVVVDVLATAVGEDDVVRSLGVITVAGLVVTHIDVVVVVLDGVIESVVCRGLIDHHKIFINTFLTNNFVLIDLQSIPPCKQVQSKWPGQSRWRICMRELRRWWVCKPGRRKW